MNNNDSYYEKIEEYLQRDFFEKKDMKISFLLGRYFSYLAYQENEKLHTASLYKALPISTRRLDKDNILSLLDKCSNVVKRFIAKNKNTSDTASKIRGMLNQLISYDQWESNNKERSLAFMMGFSYFEKKDENQNEDDENIEGA